MIKEYSRCKNKGHSSGSPIAAILIVLSLTLIAFSMAPAKQISPRGIANHVVINEVFYDSTGAEPDEEWIEIYNPTSYLVNISGWYLTDDPNYASPGGEGSYRFPDGTVIQNNSFIVVANNGTAFYAKYGFYPDFELVNTTSNVADMVPVSGSISLSNTGDDVHLFNSTGTEIDAVWYGSGGDIGSQNAAPDVSAGHSIGRNPDGEDTDNCTADFADYTTPTPDAPNTPTPELPIGMIFAVIIAISLIIFRNFRV